CRPPRKMLPIDSFAVAAAPEAFAAFLPGFFEDILHKSARPRRRAFLHCTHAAAAAQPRRAAHRANHRPGASNAKIQITVRGSLKAPRAVRALVAGERSRDSERP